MKQRTKATAYPAKLTAACYYFLTGLIIGFTALITLSSFLNPRFFGPVKMHSPQTTAAKIFYKSGDEVERFTIHFDFDEAGINKKSAAILKQVVKKLRADKSLRVNIEGHADKFYYEIYNKKISLRRANNAKKYLARYRIAKSRIKTAGFGSERPEPKNKYTEWLNRRAEVIIYKN